uniref:Uncharacterized protein n=1 Tax=Oryza nivara TaxID=4536 RepID=A0A0E0JBD2_ORYNI
MASGGDGGGCGGDEFGDDGGGLRRVPRRRPSSRTSPPRGRRGALVNAPAVNAVPVTPSSMMPTTRASRCTSNPRHPSRIWTVGVWRRWLATVAAGRWWLDGGAIIRLTVHRRRWRYVEAGKEESRSGRAVDGGNNWNRERKPCRAIWLADNGNAVWRRSPPWRRCFSIPLSFPYHILRVKTLLRFRTSGGGDPRRILLGGTALEKPLRARILSLVYALASNFSSRP